MRFILTEQEVLLLTSAAINFCADRDYTDDEALLLLDQIRDVEIAHSQFTNKEGKRLYYAYGNIADKLHRAIPELE